jgi:BioD-like phosphotransacetylase family protein
LKNKVIGRINQINDELLLAEVYRLLESTVDDSSLFQLSNNHKTAIDEAKDQIANGNYLTNEQSNKEINEWLNR